jgi:16S rRNA (guanine527-N7)-methyltransferase
LSAEGEAPPELDDRGRAAVAAIVELLATDPAAPTSVSDRGQAQLVHVADSLSGLAFDDLRAADRICDIGAGAGFPGLVLAAALPAARVTLVEASRRKCEFIARAAEAAGLQGVTVVAERAETFAAGPGAERFDAVTARAVGRLSTLAERASPLLVEGGVLVAWKGRRDGDEEAELARAAEQLAMSSEQVRWVGPYAGSENRHLHLVRKTGPTPAGLPRRPGMAKKRPRGAR